MIRAKAYFYRIGEDVCPERNKTYSSENSHNPFAFNGRFAAIFMVRLWLERAMIYS